MDSAVNAWRLHQAIRDEKEPYLDFLRQLVTEMFETYGAAPTRRTPLPVNDNTRFDEHNHLIVGIFDEGGKGAPQELQTMLGHLQPSTSVKSVMCLFTFTASRVDFVDKFKKISD